MTRLTDVDIAIEKIKQLPVTYDAETVQRCIEVLSNLPTIDAEPVRHGKWIKADTQQYFRKHYPCFTCSECGYRKDSQKKWNCCPNCMARMDEK